MRKQLIIVLLLSTVHSYAKANSAPTLQNNFCRPLIDSKKYIQIDYHAPYPKTVKFECTYQCMTNDTISEITTLSTIRVSSIEDDAYAVVCQGIKVKKVSWGYDFDGVEPFYAFDTVLKEIKKFGFENISQNNPEEIKRLIKLRDTLSEIAAAYELAGANSQNSYAKNFSNAAIKLKAIATDLPHDTQKLDQAIALIVINQGKIAPDTDEQSLIDRMLLTAAAWRIPTHLY